MKKRSFLSVIVIAITGFGGANHEVDAGFVSFTDRGSFDAAVNGQTLIDFESHPVYSQPGSYGSSLSIGDATFNMNDGSNRLFVFDSDWYNTNGTNYINHNTLSIGDIVVSFAQPVYAVGMDIGTLINWGGSATPGQFTLQLSSGDNVAASGPAQWANTGAELSFIGFVSDSAISSFRIIDLSEGVALDNLAFSSDAALSAVPEPTSMALLGLAAVGGIGARLRQRRKGKEAQSAA